MINTLHYFLYFVIFLWTYLYSFTYPQNMNLELYEIMVRKWKLYHKYQTFFYQQIDNSYNTAVTVRFFDYICVRMEVKKIIETIFLQLCEIKLLYFMVTHRKLIYKVVCSCINGKICKKRDIRGAFNWNPSTSTIEVSVPSVS